MAEWKNIYINSNLIGGGSSKAYVFNMPKNSKYAGYSFWLTDKCVHHVFGRGDIVVIGYTDEFTFKIFKQGKNFNKLDEKTITAKEFEEIFEKMDSSIRPWVKGNWHEKKDIDIINKPEKKEPIENPVADKELVDD